MAQSKETDKPSEKVVAPEAKTLVSKDAQEARTASKADIEQVEASRTNASNGSLKPDKPANESIQICMSDGKGGVVALANRNNKLTEKDLQDWSSKSIELAELAQRQENGDPVAKSIVDQYEKAMRLGRGRKEMPN